MMVLVNVAPTKSEDGALDMETCKSVIGLMVLTVVSSNVHPAATEPASPTESSNIKRDQTPFGALPLTVASAVP